MGVNKWSDVKCSELTCYMWSDFVLKRSEIKWSEVKWITLTFLGTNVPCTLGWPYTEVTWLYCNCEYCIWCILCCGCYNLFCNMCVCVCFCVCLCDFGATVPHEPEPPNSRARVVRSVWPPGKQIPTFGKINIKLKKIYFLH